MRDPGSENESESDATQGYIDSKSSRTSTPARKIRLWRPRLLVFGLLVAGAIVLWDQVLAYHLIPKRWGVVEAGHIYRSGRLSTTLVEPMLRKYGIDLVINLTSEERERPEEIAANAAIEKLGIRSVRFALAGNGTGELDRYAGALAAMVEARRNNETVLVHCEAGSQRTGGVVACYRLLVEGKPPAFVYDELQDYGWEPEDYELIDYINANMGKLANTLRTMNVIDHVPSPLPLLPDTFDPSP